MSIKIRASESGLKQCPFCGGQATLYIDAQMHGGYVFVSCNLCGGRSKAVWTRRDYGLPDEPDLLEGYYIDPAFDKARYLWNNRV